MLVITPWYQQEKINDGPRSKTSRQVTDEEGTTAVVSLSSPPALPEVKSPPAGDFCLELNTTV